MAWRDPYEGQRYGGGYSDIEDTAGGRFDARYNASLDDERMAQYRL